MLRRWGVIQHKLVLTTGLIKWIGHRREDSKADVSASVCTSSEQIASERIDSLRQRANARNVPFRISLRWPIHFWTQLKTPIYLCTSMIEELNLGLPRETSSFSGQKGSWTRKTPDIWARLGYCTAIHDHEAYTKQNSVKYEKNSTHLYSYQPVYWYVVLKGPSPTDVRPATLISYSVASDSPVILNTWVLEFTLTVVNFSYQR